MLRTFKLTAAAAILAACIGCVPPGYVKAPVPPEKIPATQADIAALRKDLTQSFTVLYQALVRELKAPAPVSKSSQPKPVSKDSQPATK